MPIKQERVITLIEAGNHYSQRFWTLYNIARRQKPIAEAEHDQLGSSADILYECFLAIANEVTKLEVEDYNSRETLALEEQHFKKTAKQNDYTRRYMARQRHRKTEGVDSTTADGEPIIKNWVPRSNPEEQTLLTDIQKRLYAVEKDSWKGSELADFILSIAPKFSPTVLIEKLMKAKRIVFIKQTNKFIVENPNQEIEEIEGEL